ncbi:hypothetical protein [uncultured Bacteroides sp.]|uniref:gp53-like domain-containing protein n=1 Tax=uncultured Bacteroides sp. TaxID=162156 RepID=UPI0026773944|nr:hypothetical protein [uncultured Bacteroides sp.]
MAEDTKTLRHTAEEIDDAVDKLPMDGDAAGIYKSALAFSTIVNDSNVTQEQLTEMASISDAWESGKMVYALDKKGGYYNLGVLNIQLSDDNSKCLFIALDQSGVLCYYSCNPSSGVAGKWSVAPVGKDLFALIEHTHTASDISEVTDKRFMTDAQKTKLDGIDMSQYAKSDLSNAMTVSLSKNGYAKFNNGLLIQWGTNTSSGQYRTVYFPTSFYDLNYSVVSEVQAQTDVKTVASTTTDTYTKSSFRVIGAFIQASMTFGYPGEPIRWFAIGRWK